MKDLPAVIVSVIIYNLYWRRLSAEQRFIRRNKLEARA